MKKIHITFTVFTVLLAFLFIPGCGEPKIDISSEQAFTASMEKVYNSVPDSEREAFRDYLNLTMEGKVPVSFFGGERKIPSYDDLIQTYALVKSFGNRDDMKLLGNINGLTRTDIINKGKLLLKLDLEERQANHQERLANLNKELAEIQKKVEADQKFEQEHQKVEVSCSGVEIREGLNFENKPWGTIGSITAFITVKNNSSEPVKHISGNVDFFDGSSNRFDRVWLTYLLPIDQGDELLRVDNLQIAPGAEWKGKVVLKMLGVNKNHPYPPKKQYSASLSDIKIILDSAVSRSNFDVESRVRRLQNLQDSIKETEAELAAMR